MLSINVILCEAPIFAMSILFLPLKLVEHIEIYALQYLIFLCYFLLFTGVSRRILKRFSYQLNNSIYAEDTLFTKMYVY